MPTNTDDVIISGSAGDFLAPAITKPEWDAKVSDDFKHYRSFFAEVLTRVGF